MVSTPRRRSAAPDASPPTRGKRRIRRQFGALARELRSLPTFLLIACCLIVGIPVATYATPGQPVVTIGQHITVGARTPDLSVSGPAQLVQIGNTELDIPRLQVYGPLRPRLVMGPVQRSAAAAEALAPMARGQAQTEAATSIGEGFARWYGWGAMSVLAFALGAAAVFGCARMLVILRRQSRQDGSHPPIAEIWHQCSRQIGRMTLLAVVATVAAWGTSGALAYAGAAHGLRGVDSLAELVGVYHVSPSPVGPEISGFRGAVIGDSRASRVGGPLVPDPSADDTACDRSTDSLAAEIGLLLPTRVLNLACPSATIEQGLRGPQQRGPLEVAPQVGRLKQVQGLEFVVVVIGPNDLGWTDFIKYCYAVENCSDNLTQGEFAYRLATFDRQYGQLLQDLNELGNEPQIIIMQSYDVFEPDANCPDSRGPLQFSGLSPTEIELLSSRNGQLNSMLAAGAEKYGFDVADPQLAPLCAPTPDKLNPDLQGLDDPHPFHPTGLGVVRMASSVVRLIDPNTDENRNGSS